LFRKYIKTFNEKNTGGIDIEYSIYQLDNDDEYEDLKIEINIDGKDQSDHEKVGKLEHPEL
jgi:hypothetical protein